MIPNLTFSLWTLPASQSAVPQMDLIPLQKTCIVLNNNASLLLMKCSKSFTQNQIFFYAEVGWWFLLFWCNSLTDLNFSSCAGKFPSLQQGTSANINYRGYSAHTVWPCSVYSHLSPTSLRKPQAFCACGFHVYVRCRIALISFFHRELFNFSAWLSKIQGRLYQVFLTTSMY